MHSFYIKLLCLFRCSLLLLLIHCYIYLFQYSNVGGGMWFGILTLPIPTCYYCVHWWHYLTDDIIPILTICWCLTFNVIIWYFHIWRCYLVTILEVLWWWWWYIDDIHWFVDVVVTMLFSDDDVLLIMVNKYFIFDNNVIIHSVVVHLLMMQCWHSDINGYSWPMMLLFICCCSVMFISILVLPIFIVILFCSLMRYSVCYSLIRWYLICGIYDVVVYLFVTVFDICCWYCCYSGDVCCCSDDDVLLVFIIDLLFIWLCYIVIHSVLFDYCCYWCCYLFIILNLHLVFVVLVLHSIVHFYLVHFIHCSFIPLLLFCWFGILHFDTLLFSDVSILHCSMLYSICCCCSMHSFCSVVIWHSIPSGWCCYSISDDTLL
jgi:hypothetical protein